jgi:hypothetical protein
MHCSTELLSGVPLPMVLFRSLTPSVVPTGLKERRLLLMFMSDRSFHKPDDHVRTAGAGGSAMSRFALKP